MLNYCIMCFGLHVCAIILCKTLCRCLLLSCMFSGKDIGCSSGFCVSDNVLHVYKFSAVYSLQIHTWSLIEAVLHTSVFKAVEFFFF